MNLKPVFECLEDRLQDKNQHYGRFSLGPVNRGQGITIGNSLRRTLLSDLSGFAITSAQFHLAIDENSSLEKFHEFSSFPGFRESIFEILLNFKDVVIVKINNCLDSDNFKAVLPVVTSGILTAKDIKLPPNLKIINPDQYIATIAKTKIFLDIELTIEEGRGSKLSPSNGKTNIHSFNQSFPVEANFLPITKVNFLVEEYKFPTEKINSLKKERILLEVWTNGSINPGEAVNKAAQICINLFQPLLEIEKEKKIDMIIINPKQKLPPKETLLEELNLSVRSLNCLKKAQIHTIADLLDYSEENLLKIKNFGLKSAEEVIEALQNRFDIRLPKILE